VTPRPIRYEGDVYRPPSEADSLILQATIGCSYNECAFCGMYRDKKFRVRKIDELRDEIAWARSALGDMRKVFLADGDALMAPPKYLHEVLAALREAFPSLRRVSCYASPQALAVRTVEQMTSLREAGLVQYYLGVESGHDAVLARMTKGVDAAEMVRVARKAHDAGVKLSTMILLGAGGEALSTEHARASAAVINAIQPRFVSTLVVTPVEGTPLFDEAMKGTFEDMEPAAITRELREFVAGLDLRGSVFRANHASNWLPIGGTLPKDKAAILAALDEAIAHPDDAPFLPEELRGL
jgi:radical SAM superfamily enzyme YgiQ (UPF0313 family)